MSRTTMKRLERLEASSGPSVLGYAHVIYERDLADFEMQRAALIASGRAKADDFFFDWNFNLPIPRQEFLEPETIPITHTHDERVAQWAEEERTQ